MPKKKSSFTLLEMLRRRECLTLFELGDQIGLSYATLIKIEEGYDLDTRRSTMKRLENHFAGWTFDDLIGPAEPWIKKPDKDRS